MQGEDYHTHQGPVPFTGKLQITKDDKEKFKRESPLWDEEFPHIRTEEQLTKMGTLEAAKSLVLDRDCTREFYYILFLGIEIVPHLGKQ